MSLVAQITASDVTAPLTGVGVLTVVGFFMKWLMNVVVVKVDTVIARIDAAAVTASESSRSLEKALDYNTRATLLMGIAQGDSAQALKAKLAGCPLMTDAPRSNPVLDEKIHSALSDLDQKEALSKLKRDDRGK